MNNNLVVTGNINSTIIDSAPFVVSSNVIVANLYCERANIADNAGTFLQNVLYDSGYIVSPQGFDVSSISGDYDHLKVFLHARSERNSAQDNINCVLNNDTTSGNYSRLRFSYAATNTNTDGTGTSLGQIPGTTATANVFADVELDLPYYTSNRNKKIFSRGDEGTPMRVNLQINRWNNTSVINRLTFSSDTTSNFSAGSRLQIIGMKNNL